MEQRSFLRKHKPLDGSELHRDILSLHMDIDHRLYVEESTRSDFLVHYNKRDLDKELDDKFFALDDLRKLHEGSAKNVEAAHRQSTNSTIWARVRVI